MASNLKRRVVGSFVKSKTEGDAPYIKFRDGVTFKPNDCVRVESKKYQLQSLEAAVAAGKLSGDIAESIKERIENIPDWVLGEVIQLQPKS